MYKRIGYKQRTLGVEARVGDAETKVSHGTRQITANTKCGSTSSVSTDADNAIFVCNPALTGKFLTLQSIAPSQMNIGEINIFVRGLCPLPVCSEDHLTFSFTFRKANLFRS